MKPGAIAIKSFSKPLLSNQGRSGLARSKYTGPCFGGPRLSGNGGVLEYHGASTSRRLARRSIRNNWSRLSLSELQQQRDGRPPI
jgi:hypothetical protein